MEYLGLDGPIVTNVNYIGSALSSPGSLLFTDHAAVWAVDKTGYRGDKKYKYHIIGLSDVSYVFLPFLSSGRIPFQIAILCSQGLTEY